MITPFRSSSVFLFWSFFSYFYLYSFQISVLGFLSVATCNNSSSPSGKSYKIAYKILYWSFLCHLYFLLIFTIIFLPLNYHDNLVYSESKQYNVFREFSKKWPTLNIFIQVFPIFICSVVLLSVIGKRSVLFLHFKDISFGFFFLPF